MKDRFKILALITIMIIIVSLSLINRGSNFLEKPNQNKKSTSQVKAYDLVKYKGSYVGDNSAVGNIIEKLPANEYNAGFSLQTNKEPYEITINYKVNQKLGEENYNKFWNDKEINEFLEKNAVVLLSLISNAEIIEFRVDNIGEKSYKYDRKNLEQKYGINLTELFKDNTSIKNFLE